MPSQGVTGHLLCFLPFPEPKAALARIRQSNPNLKVTYSEASRTSASAGAESLPDDIWKDVTYLCTFLGFPPKPEDAPKLEFVQLISAGADHVQKETLYQDSNVPFLTANGIHGPTISEWAIMMCLVSSRDYERQREFQINQSWKNVMHDRTHFFSSSDNIDKRFGILGYGSIGRQTGRIAKAMGMDVIVYTFSPRDTLKSRKDHGFIVPGTGDPDGTIPEEWHSGGDKAALHHFLSRDLDYLLISVPLLRSTRHLIGKEELALLSKRNAFLINVARGEVTVQDDIIAALREYDDDKAAASEGRPRRGIRGAALDVTDPEPLPDDHPLWRAPNCFVSPHISGTHNRYSDRALQVLELNLDRVANGQPLVNVVDRKLGYAPKWAVAAPKS